jgi:hypothetical protein
MGASVLLQSIRVNAKRAITHASKNISTVQSSCSRGATDRALVIKFPDPGFFYCYVDCAIVAHLTNLFSQQNSAVKSLDKNISKAL